MKDSLKIKEKKDVVEIDNVDDMKNKTDMEDFLKM